MSRPSQVCYLHLKYNISHINCILFIINLGNKFQNRISSALLVIFIKATEMFLFYIQSKYCPEKYCIFFQATLLYKMVQVIINGAGDHWIKFLCVRHIDIAECWKLEGKFTDVQHRHNIHTSVRENRLHNPNLSLRSPRQRGDLKSLLISVWRRKVSNKRHYVSGSYKNMCTVNISNRQVKQKFVPSLQFGIFLQGIEVAREC
jgi:hypothetical protein